MNDIQPYESSNALTKYAVTAIGSIAGGIGLFVIGGLGIIPGIIAGGVATVVGLASMASSDKTDKNMGVFLAGAGALTIASKLPIIGGLVGILSGIGALSMIGIGVWNSIKFFKGLKARS
ncbi:MAG: hypothetical protein LBG05_01385 [Treponema sp.]|jgi:hypothetical protein|nr:hypothetical protein [Treponema sp.]